MSKDGNRLSRLLGPHNAIEPVDIFGVVVEVVDVSPLPTGAAKALVVAGIERIALGQKPLHQIAVAPAVLPQPVDNHHRAADGAVGQPFLVEDGDVGHTGESCFAVLGH